MVACVVLVSTHETHISPCFVVSKSFTNPPGLCFCTFFLKYMRQAIITTMMQVARMLIPVIAAISVTTSNGSIDLELPGSIDLGVTGKVCTNEDDPVMVNTENKNIGQTATVYFGIV